MKITNNLTASTLIRVRFEKNDFYFGSLAAIFEMFTAQEVGITLRALYASKLQRGASVITDKCTISKRQVLRIKRKTNNFAKNKDDENRITP